MCSRQAGARWTRPIPSQQHYSFLPATIIPIDRWSSSVISFGFEIHDYQLCIELVSHVIAPNSDHEEGTGRGVRNGNKNSPVRGSKSKMLRFGIKVSTTLVFTVIEKHYLIVTVASPYLWDLLLSYLYPLLFASVLTCAIAHTFAIPTHTHTHLLIPNHPSNSPFASSKFSNKIIVILISSSVISHQHQSTLMF